MALAIYIIGYVLFMGFLAFTIIGIVDKWYIRSSGSRDFREISVAIEHRILSVLCFIGVLVVLILRVVCGLGVWVSYDHGGYGYEYQPINSRGYSVYDLGVISGINKVKDISFLDKTYKSNKIKIKVSDKREVSVRVGKFIGASSISWSYRDRQYLLPNEKLNKSELSGTIHYSNGVVSDIKVRKAKVSYNSDMTRATVSIWDEYNKFVWRVKVSRG